MIARGSVLGVRGSLVEARVPSAALGDGARIAARSGYVFGAVRALHGDAAVIAACGGVDGLRVGDAVEIDGCEPALVLGMRALGRAFDARGGVLDAAGPLRGERTQIAQATLAPARRAPVKEPLWTGVRAIDALLTIGRGARVGLFGPPGAGKSTLVAQLVRASAADAVVVGLIGERGREARDWISACERRMTVVCATSDRSAAERVQAAAVAFAQAHALRARGLHVVLILDSLARLASALREIAVAAGESVGRGGFPASVFADLARFVESAGATTGGSVSLLATVLSDGDERDPICDAARSLLDGHVALSPHLASAGQFPAIDVLESSSRTMDAVVTAAHARAARSVREALALLKKTADARSLGIASLDEDARRAASCEASIRDFLRQEPEPSGAQRTLERLTEIADMLKGEDPWTSASS